MKDFPAFNRTLKSEYPAIAKKIVSGIECQALDLGWTSSQLDDLTRILIVFLPARIGAITLQGIEIIVLHNDGSHRGALKFHNLLVDQPWLKHGKIKKEGELNL